eukprot:Ihof_evm4s346 gene=Ihof_evmTU4s346
MAAGRSSGPFSSDPRLPLQDVLSRTQGQHNQHPKLQSKHKSLLNYCLKRNSNSTIQNILNSGNFNPEQSGSGTHLLMPSMESLRRRSDSTLVLNSFDLECMDEVDMNGVRVNLPPDIWARLCAVQNRCEGYLFEDMEHVAKVLSTLDQINIRTCYAEVAAEVYEMEVVRRTLLDGNVSTDTRKDICLRLKRFLTGSFTCTDAIVNNLSMEWHWLMREWREVCDRLGVPYWMHDKTPFTEEELLIFFENSNLLLSQSVGPIKVVKPEYMPSAQASIKTNQQLLPLPFKVNNVNSHTVEYITSSRVSIGSFVEVCTEAVQNFNLITSITSRTKVVPQELWRASSTSLNCRIILNLLMTTRLDHVFQ